MGSIYTRKDSPWWWMKWRDAAGKLHQQATRFRVGDADQEAEARRTLELLERRVEAERRISDGVLTVRAFAEQWLTSLGRRNVLSVGQYRARFRDHVHAELGDVPLREVRPHHLAALVENLGAREPRPAPRTILGTYRMLHAMFQSALRRELVTGNPCALEPHELPENADRDPAWRATAVFSRGEVEQLLSDERLPEDRRALYAALFLGGLRIGEAADRRWRDYDTAMEPLGRLAVASSWSTSDQESRGTKTSVARAVPVHPLLAQVLAEWRLRGWGALAGRPPRAEDLIFPHAREPDRHRNTQEALHTFHRDLALVGLRRRRLHDARRTFISLAQADGALRELLKLVTHGRRASVMDLYTTPPWASLCAEVSKLKIRRLGAAEVTALPRAVGSLSGGGADAPTAHEGDAGGGREIGIYVPADGPDDGDRAEDHRRSHREAADPNPHRRSRAHGRDEHLPGQDDQGHHRRASAAGDEREPPARGRPPDPHVRRAGIAAATVGYGAQGLTGKQAVAQRIRGQTDRSPGGFGPQSSPSSGGVAPDGPQGSPEQPAERSRAATLELLPPAGLTLDDPNGFLWLLQQEGAR